MCFDPVGETMENRTNFQVNGLEAAKGLFDQGKALVDFDGFVGAEFFFLNAGSNNIETIQPGF